MQETRHLKKVPSVSGYSKKAWKVATGSRPGTRSSDPVSSGSTKKGSVITPYVGQVSGQIARLFRSRGVMTHIRPYNTIRASLVRPKDRLSMEEQAGLVYSIKCADCPASYVGETERPLLKRLKEHQRPESPVCEHMTEQSHRFNREDVAVRCHERDWFRHGVAEAICIATDRPSLNRDRGQHTLPAIYSQLLSSRDTSDFSDNRQSRDDMEASVS